MMNKMCMAAVIAASLYAGTTFAQPAAVKKIIETGQTDNRVMHQLDILTNRFGGRVIGSDAYENAAEWMMREYKRWGIDVRLEEAGELPVGFNRGPWFGRLIGGDQAMDLHFVTPSYTSTRACFDRAPYSRRTRPHETSVERRLGVDLR